MDHPTKPAELGAIPGARQIVQQCLGLEPYQQLVIFVDETATEPAAAIAEAAESLGVSQTALLVPVAIQREIPFKRDLSLLARGVAREARAILTCVNSSPECLAFRRSILETNWSARTRVGHMPGASLEVLILADVDFDQLGADCWSMEVAMARGRTLEMITYAADGTSHSLKVDLGGWERLPVASDGVISDGAWGNVPSGETYIAPLEGRGGGTVLVNGSVPGLVVEPESEVVLVFERGRLRAIEPEDSPVARWLWETQLLPAQARGDLNWSNLAEVGVGMNQAIHQLTGNMLLDEKAAGTAHVALGNNAFMGGIVQATIHCDMVTQRPTVIINGRAVMDRGQLCLKQSDWQECHADVPLEDSPLGAAVEIALSGIQAIGSPNGRLQRVLRPEPGRVSNCFVGDHETSQLANILYHSLPQEGDWLSTEELVSRASLEPELVRRVLHVLWRYELIRIR
jgi:leucyl aminopeptidase (aminopeptidase T)